VKTPKEAQHALAHFAKAITAATAQATTASAVPGIDAGTVCVRQSALVPLVPLCLASFHHQIGTP
jgi:hypothetical protein